LRFSTDIGARTAGSETCFHLSEVLSQPSRSSPASRGRRGRERGCAECSFDRIPAVSKTRPFEEFRRFSDPPLTAAFTNRRRRQRQARGARRLLLRGCGRREQQRRPGGRVGDEAEARHRRRTPVSLGHRSPSQASIRTPPVGRMRAPGALSRPNGQAPPPLIRISTYERRGRLRPSWSGVRRRACQHRHA
jgi:hypothetical protein